MKTTFCLSLVLSLPFEDERKKEKANEMGDTYILREGWLSSVRAKVINSLGFNFSNLWFSKFKYSLTRNTE
jgi:hypothetical protein